MMFILVFIIFPSYISNHPCSSVTPSQNMVVRFDKLCDNLQFKLKFYIFLQKIGAFMELCFLFHPVTHMDKHNGCFSLFLSSNLFASCEFPIIINVLL